MEKTAEKTDEAASADIQPPGKHHPSEVEGRVRLEKIEEMATQRLEGGRLANVSGRDVREHLSLMEQQKHLLPLTNAVLSGQKLRLNPEGTLVPEERVGTSAERTGASEEARDAAIALLQKFDEANKHAFQVKDAQYMQELFSALITNEWLVGAANHHPEVATRLQQTAELLLRQQAETSTGPLTTGVRWLQSVPPDSPVHKAIDGAIGTICFANADELRALRLRNKGAGTTDITDFNVGEHVINDLLEQGISLEERAARAEWYVRLSTAALAIGDKATASAIARGLTAVGVFRLLDPEIEGSLYSHLTPAGQEQFTHILHEQAQGNLPLQVMPSATRRRAPSSPIARTPEQSGRPFLQRFSDTTFVDFTPEAQAARNEEHSRASRAILPESALRDIDRLSNEVTQLSTDKKLILTESGLRVSQRQPNLLSYLTTRTGASAQAQKTAEDCLNQMATLAQSTKDHPEHQDKLKKSLLALGQSTWFQGVLRHHPEVAKKFFETACVVYDNDSEAFNALIELGTCVKDSETAKLFTAHISVVSARLTASSLISTSSSLSDRLNKEGYEPTLIDVHEMAILKQGIDALAATSQVPEEVERLRKVFEQQIQIHAEKALENPGSFSYKMTVLALRDMISLTSNPPVNEQMIALRDKCVNQYAASAKEELAAALDYEDVHAIFEEASQLKERIAGASAEKFEQVLNQCRAIYEERARALAQTALSPVDLATEEDEVPVQEEAVQEFSLVMSRLSPEGHKRTYEEVRKLILETLQQGKMKEAATFLGALPKEELHNLNLDMETVGGLVLETLRQGKTKEAATFLSALPNERLHELRLAIEGQPSSEEKTAALDLIYRNEVLNGTRKVPIEETATILLEALKNGDQRTGCVRALSRAERAELQKILEEATEIPTDLGIRQAAVPEPHPSRGEALSLIRRENTRTAILMANDPKVLKREMEQAKSKEDKRALAEEARVSIYSLSTYAEGREGVAIVLDELFKEVPPPIPHKQLGTFTLDWVRAHEQIPLPLDSDKHREEFKAETARVQEKLSKISERLAEHPATEELAIQLKKAADTFSAPPTFSPPTSGTKSASDLQGSAMKSERGSPEYTTAVDEISEDLFEFSAADFRSTSPASLAAHENPSFAFSATNFNKVSQYVLKSILTQGGNDPDEKLKNARKSFVFWLDVAEECLKRGDLSTAQAILAALQNTSVSRLMFNQQSPNPLDNPLLGKDNKPCIDLSDVARLKKLHTQLSNVKSYKEARKWIEAQMAADKPVIPYIGMLMTDATFVRDGNKDKTGKLKPNTIESMGKLVMQIQQFQDSVKKTSVRPQLHTDISTQITTQPNPTPALEKEFYDISQALLPKTPSHR
jgi:hypothetical protein